jgi:enoyl-CoA hydratase
VDYSDFAFIDVAVDDGIAVATLNRPEKLNAADSQGHPEFARSLRRFSEDDDVNVVVLRARGKAFSVGGSYEYEEEALANKELQWRMHREARDLVNAHLELEKPVITALQGYAFGSGAAYALLADFIIVERHVQFADGHVQAGLPAGDGGTIIWPLAVGMVRAKKYLLTGDMIDAVEAERIGLITEVVETGESFDRAMALARRLSAGPQQALRYTKRALNLRYRYAALQSFELALAVELETMYFGSDFERGLQSMKDGGPPMIEGGWQWNPPPA